MDLNIEKQTLKEEIVNILIYYTIVYHLYLFLWKINRTRDEFDVWIIMYLVFYRFSLSLIFIYSSVLPNPPSPLSVSVSDNSSTKIGVILPPPKETS